MVDFCKKCGSLMIVKDVKGKTMLACRSCGTTQKHYKPLEIQEKVDKKPIDSEVVIVEKSDEALPTTKTECPKCTNKEALWWMQQTRSADEAPTLFYRCTSCRHSWREYG